MVRDFAELTGVTGLDVIAGRASHIGVGSPMEALKKKVLSLLYSEVTCLIVTQAKDGILVKRGDYDALASRTRATGGRRGVDVKKGATRGEVERFSQ